MTVKYFQQLSDEKVKCGICPQNCVLKPGNVGSCKVRRNVAGEIQNETYQLYSGISYDPIEKKPLYHFYPGSIILSVGSVGCNMHCQWCQNCEISQQGIEGSSKLVKYTPENLLHVALQKDNNIGIAYTYNEPGINFETVIEVSELFMQNDLKNVMVTNGYVSKEPISEYLKTIDAFNVDIKAFEESAHHKYTGAKLKPVLENLILIKTAEKHLELTFLIVPGVNDNPRHFKKFIKWMSSELGMDVPLHISRYFPRYKYDNSPTSESVLEKFCNMASEKLNYVYAGNISLKNFEQTLCPSCHSVVIWRRGYYAKIEEHSKGGRCGNCGTKIFELG